MDNIPFINELFEECLDYGIPQSFSDLKMYSFDFFFSFHQITNRFLELELDLPDVVQPKYTPPPLLWNLPSIKYRKNELFITIDEKITLRRYSGQLISSKIDGLVNMRLFLSDYPNIEVEVADYMLSSPYFNCQYHHPLSNLSFLPIDEDMKVSFNQACKIKSTIPFVIFLDTKYCQDQFDVMSYQITQYSDHIEGLFSCQLTMNSRNSYSFNVKSLYFSLKNVILTFPFTPDDTVERITIQKNPGNGNPRWCPENDTIEWIIPTMHVNKEYVVSLVIHRCKSGWDSGRMRNASRMFSDCISQFTIPSHLISNRMKIERVQLIKTPPSYSFMIYYQINTIAKEYHIPALFSKSFSQEVDDVMCQDELTIHLEKDYKKIPN